MKCFPSPVSEIYIMWYIKKKFDEKLNMQPSGNPRNRERILGDQKFR